jgi:hypothetical protein
LRAVCCGPSGEPTQRQKQIPFGDDNQRDGGNQREIALAV